MRDRIIVLLSETLRLHDNPLLDFCLNHGECEVVLVYSFQSQLFENTDPLNQSICCNKIRQKFYIESVKVLQQNLQNIGLNLLVSRYSWNQLVPVLLGDTCHSTIIFQSGSSEFQNNIKQQLEDTLIKQGIDKQWFQVKDVWGNTLLDINDIQPFLKQIGESTFQEYQQLTMHLTIPGPTKSIEQQQLLLSSDYGRLSTHSLFCSIQDIYEYYQIDTNGQLIDSRSNYLFLGGEDEALARLDLFLQQHLQNFGISKKSINSCQSSFLSPFLSNGCISPRKVYQGLQNWLQQHPNGQSNYQLYLSHIKIKDYYIFYQKQNRTKLLKLDKTYIFQEQENDIINFNRWKQGQTGIPIVDACMRELQTTGFSKNRCRQIVANYLIMDLKLDWRWGEKHFQKILIDLDLSINLGSWVNLAGLGPTRQNGFMLKELSKLHKGLSMHCNQLYQSYELDPQGLFIRKWVPELREVPLQYLHQPWTIPLSRQNPNDLIVIGKDYPFPIHFDFTKHNNSSLSKQEIEPIIYNNAQKKVKLIDYCSQTLYEKKIYQKKKEQKLQV